MSSEEHKRIQHLRNSLFFFIAWAVVLAALILEINQAEAKDNIITVLLSGDYLSALYLVVSILLLAMAIRSLMLYLGHDHERE